MEKEEAKLPSVKQDNNSPEMPLQGRRLDNLMDLLLEKSKQAASKIAALEERCRFLDKNRDAFGIEIGSFKNSFEEKKKETKQQLDNTVSELKKENSSMKCSFENKIGDLNLQMNESKKKVGRIEQTKIEMERKWAEIGSLKNSFEEGKKETKQQLENTVSELKNENLSMKCSFVIKISDLNLENVGRIKQARTEMERNFEQKVEKMNDSLETIKLSYMSREATIEEMKRTTVSLMHSLQSREAIIEEMKREMAHIQALLDEVPRSKKGNVWNLMLLASSMFVAVSFACAVIK